MNGPGTNIDVGGVLVTGRELAINEEIALPDFSDFHFPRPIVATLHVRRLGRGVEVTGNLEGVAEGACGRCLDDVKLPLDLELEERFDQAGETGPLGENNVLTGDLLDLADLVRQTIDSALPMLLLCSEDCAGLCDECGNKRDGTCRCATPD